MSLGKRLALVGLVVAVIVAIAAGVRLRGTQKAVERVMAPVEVLAPDLFPDTTVLYAEVHGWDRSYATFETWWKKFEATAAHLAIRRTWEKDRESLPPEAVNAVEKLEGELDKVKEKFGYRPTTRDFFETYGKHTALGLLPGAKGERPRMLAVTRLPEGGAASLLQGQLAKATGVKPSNPPMHRGFPVFEEPAEGDERVFYGVGRGYLFVADSAPALKAGLDRLADATDEKKPDHPAATLSGDAILRRVCPTPGKNESFVFYLKRDTKFADWKADLAPVDEFIGNAFVLAPKDPAVAFAMAETPAKESAPLRCSFRSEAPRPWTRSLPKGLFQLEMSVALPAGGTRRMLEAQFKEFTEKPLWKELEALLKDTPRLKELLREALPPSARPDDELLARLSNDVAFIGDAVKSAFDSVADASSGEFVFAAKAYPAKDATTEAQYAFGIDLDPVTLFLLAGGLDLAHSKIPEWVNREERAGTLAWFLNMEQVRKMMEGEGPGGNQGMTDRMLGGLRPTILLAGNRLLIVTGKQMADEAVAISSAAAGNSLEDDPLFREAREQVKPGYFYLSYSKPGDRAQASWSSWRGMIDMIKENSGAPEEALEIMHAGLSAIDEMVKWTSMVRAEISVMHPDLDAMGESVTLMDPEAEKRAPAMDRPDAALGAAELLPHDTWFLWTQQLQMKPAYDALRQAFVKALPGGEDQVKELFPTEDPQFVEFRDAFVDGFLRNVRGEIGIAISPAHPKEEQKGPPGPEAFLARIPAVTCFAEFENPAKAFEAFEFFMTKAQSALNPLPFKERHKDFAENGGEPPFGTELVVTRIGDHPVAGMDFYIPMGNGDQYLVFSLCVLQRGSRIFVTQSVDCWKALATVEEKGPRTLTARLLQALPPGSVPEKVASVFLLRGDSIVDQVRSFLDPVIPGMIGLTLQGYEGRPPQERMQAHLEGWNRGVDLVLDLFRSGKWSVSHTSRTGNQVRTVQRRVAERK